MQYVNTRGNAKNKIEKGKKMRRKLLITGFEAFGGESINPSWEAVKALADRIGEYDLVKMQIPTVFGEAAQRVMEEADRIQPDVILCIGQARGRSMVTPEVVAINLREASIPDNAGNMPQNEPVCAGGPNAYFATAEIRRMTEAVKRCGIPCGLSYSAGAYVCNDLFYTLLHRYDGTDIKIGFIHVPCLPEQAGDGIPSLPLADLVRALEAGIEASFHKAEKTVC